MNGNRKTIIILLCAAIASGGLAFGERYDPVVRDLAGIGAFRLVASETAQGNPNLCDDPYLIGKFNTIGAGRLVTGIGLGVGTAAALSALVFDFGGLGLGIVEILSVGAYTVGSVFMAFPYRDIAMRIDQGKLSAPKPMGALWGSALTYGFGMGCLLSLGFGWGTVSDDPEVATACFVMGGICHVAAIGSYVYACIADNAYQDEVGYIARSGTGTMTAVAEATPGTGALPILGCSLRY